MGDLPELSSRFVQTQHSHVFAFAQEKTRALELLQRYRIKRSRRTGIGQPTFRSESAVKRQAKVGQVPHDGATKKEKLRPTLVPGLKQISNEGGATGSDTLSHFALFLLQVRLWTYGYYGGALDGQWGLMSAKALGRFLDEHETDINEKDAIAKRSSWLAGNSQALVIDLAYLLSYMVSRLDEAAEVTNRSEIDSLVEVALDSDSRRAPSNASQSRG